ncbi:MAG: penicillin acylase family protein [Bacteroidetes bacterium]|nr:penicillin acylase family protein [Bacteroidota bacterium]MBS1650297.1 penicillin acylase family protein [Bacteroidota bacterium]
MKIVPAIIAATLTTALIITLNTQLPVGGSKTPRLGYFLSPQKGFWKNAEPTDVSFDEDIKLHGLKAGAEVYFDDRLIPHVYAENDYDAYFIQGYLHAKFRLWQMEFETYVAAGRLSEIVGESRLNTDKYFRRLGMVYAAENSLKAAEANADTKNALDAYTAGVNSYINNLNENDIPLEYKLLDYKPEEWTNLKTALFLKFMSFDLSGQGDADLGMTNTKNFFGWDTYKKLFPTVADSLDPIIPKGTVFEKAGINVSFPKSIDSLYFNKTNDIIAAIPPIIPDKDNGSNNWAVAGSKTKSGKPILCNDPHLGLNLPSLWFEMQITTPTYSAYGVSFPGTPAIPIGFNDSCAWGETNAGRDVKDFYEIKFKDSTMQEYWFNNAWVKTQFRREVIKVKGKPDDVELLAMTVFGPVMYDKKFQSNNKDGKYYALRWTAHDASNELLTFYKLNRSKNYLDYVEAISTFECPGQNFVFACNNGDIAIRQQGKFPAKWKRQGDFVMPGTDSSYMWQGFIDIKENPQMTNPARGFVSSANQMSVDSTYPYYLGRNGNFPLYRGIEINKRLSVMNNITPADMEALQTDNYNVFAATAKPVLLKYIDETKLNDKEKKYLNIFKSWNLRADINEQGSTVFKIWWDSVYTEVYADEYSKAKLPMYWPEQSTLLEAVLKDSNYAFADNILTPNKVETLHDVVLTAFQKATKTFTNLEKDNKLEWGKYKDTRVNHLLKLPALSRLHLPIGGGENIINATKSEHGPSWRMVVQLTDKIEAYAVYPGGQSGNPGSKYYDTFIDTWAAGKYYTLLFLKKQEARHNNRIKWHITFING